MAVSSDHVRYISISGPTGSGKSALAEKLCRERNIPLINADSIQAYQLVNIGSAKPSPNDLKGIHHALYDFIPPVGEWTAPQFLRDLEQLRITPDFAQKDWVLCGGSGFYIQVAERGVPDVPPTNQSLQNELKRRLQDEGSLKLYDELKKIDPEAAAKISSNDHYRLLRYLETSKITGKTQKERENAQNLKSSLAQSGRFIKFVMHTERDWLEARLERRTQEMFDRGLLSETEQLLAKGLENWAPLKSVGYKETVAYLKKQSGQLSEHTTAQFGDRAAQVTDTAALITDAPWISELNSQEDLKRVIVRHSLQLAKKQKTWWKRDSDVVWIPAHNTLQEQYALVVDHLNRDPL